MHTLIAGERATEFSASLESSVLSSLASNRGKVKAGRRVKPWLFPSGVIRLLQFCDQIDDIAGSRCVPKI